MRAALAILTVALCAACTTSADILKEIDTGAVPGAYIEGVPFVHQRPDTCGAAALASVLQHAGHAVSEEDLARTLRAQQNEGVITIELVLEARAQGFLAAQRYGVMPEDLMRAIDAGVAPIVLHGSLAHELLGRYHYSVLTAYDRTRRVWIGHDGTDADVIVPFDRFDEDHARADRWAMLIAHPNARPKALPDDVHLEFGLQAEEQQWADAAAHHYGQAAWRPQTLQALINLSNVALHQNHLDQAQTLLQMALQIDEGSAAAQNSLAWVLLKRRGDLDEAERLARAASEHPDIRPYALDTLFHILRAQNRTEDAEEVRQQTAREFPKTPTPN